MPNILGLRGGALALALASSGALPAAAQANWRFSGNAGVSAGLSSSPFLTSDGDDDDSTANVDLSLSGRAVMVDDRGDLSIEAIYRLSHYFEGYGTSHTYGVDARTTQRLSPSFSISGGVGYSSSIPGENGFGRLAPGVPLPDAPEVLPVDPTLIGLRQRQNSLSANASARWQPAARDSFSGGLSTRLATYSGGFGQSSRTYSGNLAYDRTLSGVTGVGVTVSGDYTEFGDLGASGSAVQSQLTFRTRLSPFWRLNAGAGIQVVDSDSPIIGFDQDRAVGFSGSLDMCRQGTRTSLCLSATRDASATGIGTVSQRTAASIAYSYKLSERSGITANASYSSSDQPRGALNGLVFDRDPRFVSVAASYNRTLSRRMSGGASASYRRAIGGFSDRQDAQLSIYINSSFGDAR